ncbi:MAG TPA: HAMP domain-containing sensor histidine kinase [Panacibacter sp.]|nr:HAMP domain-containing sensor histidine kinase [Panacibacter sp.]
MSKALLQKNTRSLLLWLPLVLLAASLLFYLVLEWHTHHMQEKQLLLKQTNVWDAFTSQPTNFIRNVRGEYDIKEVIVAANIIENEPIDTNIYYQNIKQFLPFEVLTSAYSWNGKTYLLSTYVSSKEIHHLVIKVFATEAVILLLLLLTVVIVNKRNSRSLWTPFFSTLQNVNQYDITRNQNIDLPPSTGTTEFDELNKGITSLIGNINQAYHQQKQFVENASHEMQTPLAIIRSKLELLINQPELTEKAASLLSDITDANDRLSQMSRTLLLLAKIENNQFPDVEEIDVSNLLQNIVNKYQNHYDGNFPDIIHNVHSEKKIVANHSLIEILLSNLVKNAVEHNQPGGTIIITLTNAELSVKNTGVEPEIAPEVLFERFRKGSHKSKTTGLGLAMVKQICLLYHYRIEYTYQNGWHEVMVKFSGE